MPLTSAIPLKVKQNEPATWEGDVMSMVVLSASRQTVLARLPMVHGNNGIIRTEGFPVATGEAHCWEIEAGGRWLVKGEFDHPFCCSPIRAISITADPETQNSLRWLIKATEVKPTVPEAPVETWRTRERLFW